MSKITGQYVDVNGCRTYYESAGTGPTLLCLSPSGRESSQWTYFLENFSDRYRVIAPDLPGHGKSEVFSKDMPYLNEIGLISEFLKQFCTEIDAEKIAVTGCSLGGNLCYSMAAFYPEMVHAIIPMQGAAYTPLMMPGGLGMLTHPHVNLVHHLSDNVDTLTGSGCSDKGRHYLQSTVANVNPWALQADLLAYCQTDIRDIATQIKCPILSVRGTEDWFVTDEIIEMTTSVLSKDVVVEYAPIEKIGHFPQIESPEETARIMTAFLERYYPA